MFAVPTSVARMRKSTLRVRLMRMTHDVVLKDHEKKFGFRLKPIAMSAVHTFKESPDVNDDRSQYSENASISSDNDPIVPKGMLPEYLAEAFGEIYAEDGLLVLGKGLGCLQLIASFVRFNADTKEDDFACLAEEQDIEESIRFVVVFASWKWGKFSRAGRETCRKMKPPGSTWKYYQ
jgi:hypothetical protein